MPDNATDAEYFEYLKSRCTVSENGCWECAGFQYKLRGVKSHSKGYVDFSYRRVRWRAHRLAYTIAVGPIPDGLEVCHSCDNPPCCNPKHLFLGTGSENAIDRVAKGRDRNRGRTHCIRGHELSGSNVRIRATLRGYRRQCITCTDQVHHKTEKYFQWRREWQRNRRARLRAERHRTDEERRNG